MTARLQQLIGADEQATFQLVLDQITAILAAESQGQQDLAQLAGKDPCLWKIRVFRERSNPWEFFEEDGGFSFPIVNVSLDNMSYDGMSGNDINRQKCTAVYHIDCYGAAVSCDNPIGGHDPGDERAALESHRACRLVRDILMSGYYKYLRMRGVVGKRQIQSITAFQPSIDGRPVQRALAVRAAFAVDFTEMSQQFEGQDFELMHVKATRLDTGEIIFTAQFPTPPDN